MPKSVTDLALGLVLLNHAALCGGEQIRVAPLGKPGAYTGFALHSDTGASATVTFGSMDNVAAAQLTTSERGLEFTQMTATPTPALGAGSRVAVRWAKDDPYPEVAFRLVVKEFDQVKWEAAMGSAPYHFLCCRVAGAEIFHHRGWSIPTPVIDPYPLHNKGTGYGRQIVSNWSRDWTYAPALGAHPLATVGLWTPTAKRYVGYDFHGARLTDHSEKDVGTAYCWKLKDRGQFIALVWPYASPYQDLRYPKPSVVDTRFHLLHSASLAGDDDPNLFVTRFIWQRYREHMPGAPRMNDLSWLSRPHRLRAFPAPSVGRLLRRVEEPRWWKKGALTFTGIAWDGDPVTYLYETRQRDRVAQLHKDIDFLLDRAACFKVGEDECVAWRMPLEGEAVDMFGPDGVPTIHNVQTWQLALTLLDVCRNEPARADTLMPYVDGALRFTKHVLYTRNGYADVPCAQFCWGAGPVTSFCLRYHYTWRDDPQRRSCWSRTRGSVGWAPRAPTRSGSWRTRSRRCTSPQATPCWGTTCAACSSDGTSCTATSGAPQSPTTTTR